MPCGLPRPSLGKTILWHYFICRHPILAGLDNGVFNLIAERTGNNQYPHGQTAYSYNDAHHPENNFSEPTILR